MWSTRREGQIRALEVGGVNIVHQERKMWIPGGWTWYTMRGGDVHGVLEVGSGFGATGRRMVVGYQEGECMWSP